MGEFAMTRHVCVAAFMIAVTFTLPLRAADQTITSQQPDSAQASTADSEGRTKEAPKAPDKADEAKAMADKVMKAFAMPVTLKPPFKPSTRNGRTDAIRLGTAVQQLVAQTGLRFNATDSRTSLGSDYMQYVTPNFTNATLYQALTQMLLPLRLNIQLRGDEITLMKLPPEDPAILLKRPITLEPPYRRSSPTSTTDKISLEEAVREIARQAGLGFDWNESVRNMQPFAFRYVYPQYRNITCAAALNDLLPAWGLTFTITNGQVVVIKK
jgi:hypothetical protein